MRCCIPLCAREQAPRLKNVIDSPSSDRERGKGSKKREEEAEKKVNASDGATGRSLPPSFFLVVSVVSSKFLVAKGKKNTEEKTGLIVSRDLKKGKNQKYCIKKTPRCVDVVVKKEGKRKNGGGGGGGGGGAAATRVFDSKKSFPAFLLSQPHPLFFTHRHCSCSRSCCSLRPSTASAPASRSNQSTC